MYVVLAFVIQRKQSGKKIIKGLSEKNIATFRCYVTTTGCTRFVTPCSDSASLQCEKTTPFYKNQNLLRNSMLSYSLSYTDKSLKSIHEKPWFKRIICFGCPPMFFGIFKLDTSTILKYKSLLSNSGFTIAQPLPRQCALHNLSQLGETETSLISPCMCLIET